MLFLVRYPPAIKPGTVNDAMILTTWTLRRRFWSSRDSPIPAVTRSQPEISFVRQDPEDWQELDNFIATTIIPPTTRSSCITGAHRAP